MKSGTGRTSRQNPGVARQSGVCKLSAVYVWLQAIDVGKSRLPATSALFFSLAVASHVLPSGLLLVPIAAASLLNLC